MCDVARTAEQTGRSRALPCRMTAHYIRELAGASTVPAMEPTRARRTVTHVPEDATAATPRPNAGTVATRPHCRRHRDAPSTAVSPADSQSRAEDTTTPRRRRRRGRGPSAAPIDSRERRESSPPPRPTPPQTGRRRAKEGSSTGGAAGLGRVAVLRMMPGWSGHLVLVSRSN